MGTLVILRDWIETTLEALSPATRSGVPFRVSRKPTPLSRPPYGEDHDRSFRVISNRDTRVRPVFATDTMEIEGTLAVEVGYLAAQDDKGTGERIGKDTIQLAQALTQYTASLPSGTCQVDFLGASLTDLTTGGGGGNVLVNRLLFRAIYTISTVRPSHSHTSSATYPEQAIREWAVAAIEAISPTQRTGDAFREDSGEEPLANAVRRHRRFRVHLQPGPIGLYYVDDQGEWDGVLSLQVAYLGEQDDHALEDWLDDDDEQILQALLAQRDTGRPGLLQGLERLSGTVEDVTGNRDVVIHRIDYGVRYDVTV